MNKVLTILIVLLQQKSFSTTIKAFNELSTAIEHYKWPALADGLVPVSAEAATTTFPDNVQVNKML
jgi:hypothetical protein